MIINSNASSQKIGRLVENFGTILYEYSQILIKSIIKNLQIIIFGIISKRIIKTLIIKIDQIAASHS